MLNRPSNAVTTRVVVLVGALLAVLTFLMLTTVPQDSTLAHPHDPEETHRGVAEGAYHIHYPEDSDGPVRSFDSLDPELAGIQWAVRGVDAEDFEISSRGVLTFKNQPDYENPTDRGLDLNNDDDFEDDGEFEPGDSNYQITVSATETRSGNNLALPAKRSDRMVTVIVGNEDDDGDLTLQWLQPEVDVEIGTTLTDPDGITANHSYTWYISKAADPVVGNLFHWNVIRGQTGTSYTPVAADVGKYLWVNVVYTNPLGGSGDADAKSMYPVRAAVSASANASPDFTDPTTTRTVPESTAVGDPVGAAVTATDTNNDTLTYELVAAASPNDRDIEFFNIGRASGQVTVAQDLDYDAVGDRTDTATAGTYIVIVRATDPSGSADDITVTVTAGNVNEAPIVTGRAELTVAEEDDDGYTALPDAPAITDPPDPTNQDNEYVYVDPDHLDSIASWRLEGDDAGAFDHSGRFEPRYLQFKEAPDFENPTDRNMDNVYEVTLVATDTDPLGTGAGVGRVNVWVVVTNAEEEGEVVFTEGETAYLNEMLVAEVQDPDDKGGDLGEPYQDVHIVSWQWSRSTDDDDEATAPFVDIDGATKNSYTPEGDDRGYYLRVTATYTDPHSAEDDPETTEVDERIQVSDPPADGDSLRTVMATTDNVVRLAPGPASVPTFGETGAVTRYVAENTGPGGNVGAPVTATGPGTLEYSLDGSDADYFNIDAATGQITVGGDDLLTEDVEAGTDPELDFDDDTKKQSFSVTVKVEVSGGEATQNAQVDVTIVVTDVDELPTIADVSGDPAMTAVNYLEIDEDGAPNTADVATYVGTDPEGDTISWDLRGADAALFTIDGGVLKFRTAPDFENPKDRAGANTATATAVETDNDYNIVIRAIASRASGDTGPAETVDTTVIVTVDNVDEDGDVDISWLQPEVGTAITASLTDPDGDVTPTWAWTVSEAAANVLDVDNDDHWGDAPGDGADEPSYEPVASDEGKYLRATATYTEDTETRTARMMSAYPVQAEGGGELNGSPDFVGEKADRTVAETADVGADVGLPVTASLTAGDASKDRLTYSLRAVTATDLTDVTGVTLPSGTGTEPADDLAAFDIVKATGQITVAGELDFESRGTPDDGKYVVVVEVRDPSADSEADPTIGYDFIVVVITAEDRNEDPVLSGRPELTIDEIDGGDEDAANPLFVGNTADADPTVNVYNVVDEDARAGTQSWQLQGEDAGELQLIGSVGRTLVFRNQPDYENPADADGDNVYKVTIVTLDGEGGRAEFDVCIAVTNINEEGKITLRDADGDELVQPYAHGPITADLTDPDGGITGVTWVWTKSPTSPNASWPTDSIGATATYTPSNDDTSDFLRVTATYMDAKNNTTDDTDDRTVMATTEFSVLEVEDQKRPPAFPAEYADGVEREVAENAPSTTFVGDPLPLATDPDDPQGTGLRYSLEDDDTEGAESEFFELVSTDAGADGTAYTEDDTYSTQIRVKLHAEAEDLDHEEGGMNGTYEVTLRVTDGELEATLPVKIIVTDRNDAPSTPAVATGALRIAGPGEPDYSEDRTDAVATYATAGPGSAEAVTWSLSGVDMAAFDINADGELTFLAMPDFEEPTDADGLNDYEVTVNAMVGTDELTLDVTVNVTNANDEGEVTFDTDPPVAGQAITAMLDDPDGADDTTVTWQWAVEDSAGSGAYTDIAGETSASYTPDDGDVGKLLQATATYDDPFGTGMTAEGMTAAVTAEVTTGNALGDRFDMEENGGNGDGVIDEAEVYAAVLDYLFNSQTDIALDDLRGYILAFLFPPTNGN